MRLAPFVLSIIMLGIPGNLEASRPVRKSSHVKPVAVRKAKRAPTASAVPKARRVQAVAAVHKVKRGETAGKVARLHGLSMDELAELNPKINLSRLSVGAVLRIEAPAVARPAVVERPVAAKVVPAAVERPAVRPEPVRTEPVRFAQETTGTVAVTPVSPIPSIAVQGPAVLLHLERLLPTNMDIEHAAPFRKVAHAVPPLTSQDLVPVFPPASGLEYESRIMGEMGFEPADPGRLDLLWPVETRRISSVFGPRVRTKTVRLVKARRTRRVLVKFQGSHKGLDLAAPMGSDVYAAQDGRVTFSGWDPGYGNCIYIDHGNGIETRYAHHRMNFAQEGDIVRRGQKIAEVGSTGHSTGPHLHFELRLQGQARNPLTVMNDVEEIPAEVMAFNETIKSSQE